MAFMPPLVFIFKPFKTWLFDPIFVNFFTFFIAAFAPRDFAATFIDLVGAFLLAFIGAALSRPELSRAVFKAHLSRAFSDAFSSPDDR